MSGPSPTATIGAVAPGREPAWVQWTPEATTVHLGPAHERRLAHGSDVDALALTRDPSGTGAPAWQLDLVRRGETQVRLLSTDWDLDRDRGARAARVGGLDLLDAAPGGSPRPARPGDLPGWLTAAGLSLPIAVVVAVVAALAGVRSPWLAVLTCLPVLVYFLGARLPGPIARRAERLLLRAEPAPHASRAAAHGRLLDAGPVRVLRTTGRALALPPADDALAAQRVARASTAHGRVEGLLLVEDAAGDVLATLYEDEWGAPSRLAPALGVDAGQTPSDAGTHRLLSARVPPSESSLLVVLGALVGGYGLVQAVLGTGVPAALACALALALLALTLGWGVVGAVRTWHLNRGGRPR